MSAWLARARAAAVAPPARPRRSLFLDPGRRPVERIGSIEAEIAERMIESGLALRATDSGYLVAGPADTALAAIASWLHRERLVASWRDEPLAVVNEHGIAVARIERSVVRVLGLATEAVHLVGVVADGAVWVQQRAFDKATDPGRWDTLMGGQVAAGESIADTLARETMEEAGLALVDLHGLERCEPIAMRRPVAEGYMVERVEVFRALVPDGVAPANRDGEVARFECLARAALERRLGAGDFTLEATLILGAELERRDEAARR